MSKSRPCSQFPISDPSFKKLLCLDKVSYMDVGCLLKYVISLDITLTCWGTPKGIKSNGEP